MPDSLTLDCFLVYPLRHGTIRILYEHVVLTIDPEDVLHVEESPVLAEGVSLQCAVAVMLTLRKRFRVLDIIPSYAFEEVFFARPQPFAVAARATKADVTRSAEFETLERGFLLRYGLEKTCL
jgi:hypothetical protein